MESVNSAGYQNIYLVGPKTKLEKNLTNFSNLYTRIIQDPGLGLPEAINEGVRLMPDFIKYVGWLGDDDLLTPNSLRNVLHIFNSNRNVVATFGACSYIDENGHELFVNKSGSWAIKYMNFLPNLIPQPGSVFRRDTFEKIGGVKSTYPLAFDFELFFNLRKCGEIKYISEIQSSFRWHPDSMSVDQRMHAVRQTSAMRKNFLPKPLTLLSILWEPLLVKCTILIGKHLDKKLKSHG